MASPGAPESSIGPWQATRLRLTLFAPPSAKVDVESLWKTTVGETHESYSSKEGGRVRVAEGLVNKGKLTLVSQFSRLDWYYSPSASAEPPEPADEVTEPFNSLIDRFGPLAQKALVSKDNPASTRIAWGAYLKQTAANSRETLSILKNYLPTLQMDPEGSNDLIYQINRPRVLPITGIGKLKINRLSKWGAFMVFRVTIPAFAVGSNFPLNSPTPLRHEARLELDINTDADRTDAIPSDNLPDLLDKLMSLGKEISQKGDVA